MGIKRKTRKDYMRMLRNDYVVVHGYAPIDPDDLYVWAVKNNKWEPQQRNLRSQFKEELADALREETFVDPQNRTVKLNFAVIRWDKGKQQVLWSDFEHATDGHMRVSLRQMWRGVKGDVKSLKNIQDSWNDNNVLNSKIEMSFNFDEEGLEDQFPTEYPDAPPSDADDDDDDILPTEVKA